VFENLTERLGRTLRNLRGQGRLTDANVRDTLREVRMALLEADVALPVVKEFVDRVRVRALGQEVMESLTPARSSSASCATSSSPSWARPARGST